MTMRYAHLSPGYLAAASSKLDGIMPETGKIELRALLSAKW